jgi:hypothetical protein
MKILALGGRPIKENYDQIKEIIRKRNIDALMLSGCAIFHDFQITTESLDGKHSIPLDKLLEDYTLDEKASHLVWKYYYTEEAPKGSLVDHAQLNNIPVLLFSDLGTDFFHLFPYISGEYDWQKVAERSYDDFACLVSIMRDTSFIFICMGSEAHLPEIMVKALAVAKPTNYKTISIDPEGMGYRLRTRFKTWKICSFKDALEDL